MRSKLANRSRSGAMGQRLRKVALRSGVAWWCGARRTNVPFTSACAGEMDVRFGRHLDRVDRALARHVHRAAEGVAGLVARPERVELVGDVGEHDALHA